MLVRLLPEQVSKYWKSISPALQSSLPEDMSSNGGMMTHVLQSLLTGAAVCWAIVDENGKIVGLVMTTIFVDLCAGGSDLLIYALYSRGNLTSSLIRDGLRVLIAHAKEHGCGRVTAYTSAESVIRLVKNSLGGKEEATLISIPINGEIKL